MCHECFTPRARLSRRALIGGGLALAAMPVRAGAARNAASSDTAPDAALLRLMQGNARYAANAPAQRDFSAGRMARAQSQHPIAAILSCADSRVSPELVFDQGPGDLFVVRVAGNFVNDDGLASLEYAVKFLGVPLVMVLGHSGCGAVDAAIKAVRDGITLPGHLHAMIRDIKPAADAALRGNPADPLPRAVAENVGLSVRRLEEAAPILSEAAVSGTIRIVGGQYDLTSGKVVLMQA